MVEIVKMMVVAEQHVIEWAELASAECRPGKFPQDGRAGGIFPARWIKGWIGKQPNSAEFQQRSRAADIGDRELWRVHFNWLDSTARPTMRCPA
jgi:hypothetical protein